MVGRGTTIGWLCVSMVAWRAAADPAPPDSFDRIVTGDRPVLPDGFAPIVPWMPTDEAKKTKSPLLDGSVKLERYPGVDFHAYTAEGYGRIDRMAAGFGESATRARIEAKWHKGIDFMSGECWFNADAHLKACIGKTFRGTIVYSPYTPLVEVLGAGEVSVDVARRWLGKTEKQLRAARPASLVELRDDPSIARVGLDAGETRLRFAFPATEHEDASTDELVVILSHDRVTTVTFKLGTSRADKDDALGEAIDAAAKRIVKAGGHATAKYDRQDLTAWLWIKAS